MRGRYIWLLSLVVFLGGCAMSEEMRRIDEVKQAQRQRELAHSGNLTGEQIFIRSCNTCHPGGDAGVGPSLLKINETYPDDAKLKKFIRSGKGMMPAQPKEAINDDELSGLIIYLRALK